MFVGETPSNLQLTCVTNSTDLLGAKKEPWYNIKINTHLNQRSPPSEGPTPRVQRNPVARRSVTGTARPGSEGGSLQKLDAGTAR